ncbi:MAG: hypothetical protein V4607_02025 [Pseudomonadota bacterium]
MAIQLFKAGESPVAVNNGATSDGLYATKLSYTGSVYVVSVYKWNGLTATYDELIGNLYQFSNLGASFITQDSLTCRWSADGLYLLIFNYNNSPKLTVFKRTDDTFVQLDPPSDLPVDYVTDAVWSQVEHSFLVYNGNTSKFYFYKIIDDDIVSLTQELTLASTLSAELSPNGQYLAFARYAVPYVPIYAKSGDTYVPFINLSGLSAYSNSLSVEWSPDGNYLAVRNDGNLRIYKVDGGAFTLLTSINVNTTGSLPNRFMEWSPDSNYLVTAKNNNTSTTLVGWTVIRRVGDTFTDIGTPGGAFTSAYKLSAHFVSNTLLLTTKAETGVSGSPVIGEIVKLYELNGASISAIANPLTSFPTIPPSTNFGATSFVNNNGPGLGGSDKLVNIFFYNYPSGSPNYSWLYFPWRGEGISGTLDGVTGRFNPLSSLKSTLARVVAAISTGGQVLKTLGNVSPEILGAGQMAPTLEDLGSAFVAPAPDPSGYFIEHLRDFNVPADTFYPPSFSNDDEFVALGIGEVPYVKIFRKNATSYTAIANSLYPPVDSITSSSFVNAVLSPDGNYLAVALQDGSPDTGLLLYKRSGSFFNRIDGPDVSATYSYSGGLAWSPDGTYLAASCADAGGSLIVFKRTDDAFTKLDIPPYPADAVAVDMAWSPDGVYLAVAGYSDVDADWLAILKRTDDNFEALDTIDEQPDGYTGLFPSWSPDGVYVAVGNSGGSSPVLVYSRDGDNFTRIGDPAPEAANSGRTTSFSPAFPLFASGFNGGDSSQTLGIYTVNDGFVRRSELPETRPSGSIFDTFAAFGQAAFGAVWKNDSQAILSFYRTFGEEPEPPEPSPNPVTHIADFTTGGFAGNGFCPPSFAAGDAFLVTAVNNAVPPVRVFKRVVDSFVELADCLSPAPSDVGIYDLYHAKISPDGNYLAVSGGGDTRLAIYKRDGDSFIRLPDAPDIQASSYCAELAWSPDSTYLSATVDDSEASLFVYKRTGDVFNKLPTPSYTAPNFASEHAWSPDGTYLAVGGYGTDKLTIFKRDGDDFTALYPDIAPDSLDNVVTPTWSADGNYLAVSNLPSDPANVLPDVIVYRRDGDTFTKVNDSWPTSGAEYRGLSYSRLFPYLATGTALSTDPENALVIYLVDGETYQPKEDIPDQRPDFLGGAVQRRCVVTFGERYLAVVSTDSDEFSTPVGSILSLYLIENTGGVLSLQSIIEASDDTRTILGLLLGDLIHADSAMVTRMIQQLSALSMAELDQLLSLQMTKTAFLIDHPQLDDSVSAMLRASLSISDIANIDAVLFIEGQPYAAWVVNTESGAPSEYQNWNFDSMCRLGDRYYAVSDAGLFLLEGDDDQGAEIAASIRTGDMDFGSAQIKRPLEAHIGYTANGDLVLKVTVEHEGERSEYWYRCNKPVNGTATEAKINLGKGLASRHWQFELMNVNGADFEFEAIHLQMLELSRRI